MIRATPRPTLNYKLPRIVLCTIVFYTLSLLSGCSIFDSRDESTNTTQYNWEQARLKLQKQTHWSLIGKIGVRTPEDSLTAAINQWVQSEDSFEIDLSSTFFGLGASKLKGNSQFLTLMEAGEEPVSSNQPNTLIEATLGFPLPLTQLTYWIKGLPSPNHTFQIEFNQQGLPASIKQNHWQLYFSKYHFEQGIPLPGKIKLERKDTRIILAIKKWTLN